MSKKSLKQNKITMDDKGVSFGLKPEQLEPLHNLVLLKLLRPNETPAGLTVVSGLDEIVPADVRAKTSQKDVGTAAKGEVLAVGPGKIDANGVLVPVSVAPGDVVLMPPPRSLGGLGDNLFMVRDSDLEFKYHVTGRN